MPIKIKYVSLSNGRWVYRPRKTKDLLECDFPVDSRGFLKPPIKLGMRGDSDDKIMAAYVAAKNTLIAEVAYNKRQLGYTCGAYLKSDKFKAKAPTTQRSYETLSRSILSHPIKINGKEASLADMQLESLSKPIMNKIRHKRLKLTQDKGNDGRVLINREVAFLSTAIKWGLNNIPELPNMINPLLKIDKFEEPKNERYVSDEEMKIQCVEAAKIVDYLPTLIRLNYLIGSRGIESTDLRYSHCIEKGIDVDRRKGSKSNIIAWSPALIEIVEEAKKLNKTRKILALDPYLITNTQSNQLTSSAIQSAMGRLKKRMKQEGLGEVFFTLHKTKSKAQSDSKDDDISGLSEGMKKRYNTKKQVIKTGLK